MNWSILGVAVLLAGCTAAPPHLEIDPANSTLEGTNTWTVRLTLESDLTYDHPGCSPALFMMEVYTPNGTVPLYEYGVEPLAGPCIVKETTLKEGVHEKEFNWNGRLEQDAPSGHGGDPVDPGTYPLTARLRGTDILASGTVKV